MRIKHPLTCLTLLLSLSAANAQPFGALPGSYGNSAFICTSNCYNPATITPSGAIIVTLNNTKMAVGSNAAASLVRSQASRVAGVSSKVYCELTSNNSGTQQVFGLAQSSTTPANIWTGQTTGIFIFVNGAIYVNGTQRLAANTNVSWNPGTLEIAFDFTDNEIWARSSPTSLWNNNASALPDTNVGGISFSVFNGDTLYLMSSFGITVNIATTYVLNCGQAAFLGTVPTGFSAWPNP